MLYFLFITVVLYQSTSGVAEIFDQCFKGTPGWFSIDSKCVFPLTQFQRNFSDALQMCGASNYSSGYREIDWLISRQLLRKFSNDSDLLRVYWTGFRVVSKNELGAPDGVTISNYTSIYNPTWAKGEPPAELSESQFLSSCVALDLRSDSEFGWRLIPCETHLPVLCQNYACRSGYFRCLDNSRCIPPSFQNDGFNDCLDGSDENTYPRNLPSTSNPLFESPIQISSQGVLSPKTIRYGRGSCQHKWTIISPNRRRFAISVEWLNPSSPAILRIEEQERNEIFIDSRNTSKKIDLRSTAFVITASGADLRKPDVRIHYQEINEDLCRIEENDTINFNSSAIPLNCNYHYSTDSDFIALLIERCQSLDQIVALIRLSNHTIPLYATSSTRLLIIPANKLSFLVNTTWPDDYTQLKIKIINNPTHIFLNSGLLDFDWIPGSFNSTRQLTVNVENQAENSTWIVKRIVNGGEVHLISNKFTRELNATGVHEIINSSSSIHFRIDSQLFEIHASYYSELVKKDEQQIMIATEKPHFDSSTFQEDYCKLPTLLNGYIDSVTTDIENHYSEGTKLRIRCNVGYTISFDEYVCNSMGKWQNLPSGSAIECQKIMCPSSTQIEADFGVKPLNGSDEQYFGAIRFYSFYPNLHITPFCVCGSNNTWKCYNDRKAYGAACLVPELIDGISIPSNVSVFSPGETIMLECFACPTWHPKFTCSKNGEWVNGTSAVVNRTEIKCDCTMAPDFDDPCLPNGVYRQHPGGIWACICNQGYKFDGSGCIDIDECAEGISLCDSIATCHNTIGAYNCSCPVGTMILDKSSRISEYMIPGISCIELFCDVNDFITNFLSSSSLKVIYPPKLLPFYSYGQSTPPLYATNLCSTSNLACVVPFSFTCYNSSWIVDKHLRGFCEINDENLNIEGIDGYNWPPMIFSEAKVSCKDPFKKLIGRDIIFCNSSLLWDTKPRCVFQNCANLTQFVNYPLRIDRITRISNESFDWQFGNAVSFGCDDGYTLGNQSNTIFCQLSDFGEPEWSNQLPKCYPMKIESIIEKSMVFKEVDILGYNWIMTNDWKRTTNGCFVHEFPHPTSFAVTSKPIFIDSEEIEVVLNIQQCNSMVQLAIYTSDKDDVPSLARFTPAIVTSSAGTAVVKLKTLRKFISVSLASKGFVRICALRIRFSDQCRHGFSRLGCGSVNSCCSLRRIPKCDINSCSNGVCIQKVGNFECICNEGFIYSNQSCIPDNCSYTNTKRTSGYNCFTGKNDYNIICNETDMFGDFCQYKGYLTNSSFIYLLKCDSNSEIALSTNVCNKFETKYTVPHDDCVRTPIDPPTSECSSCDPLHTSRCVTDVPYKGAHICECETGFIGRRCDVPTFCLSPNSEYRCLNGGTCNVFLNQCQCADGWSGNLCENRVLNAKCAKHCANGICESLFGQEYCNCYKGYVKDSDGRCTIAADLCELNNPCQQKSQCLWNTIGGLETCECSDNWIGDFCNLKPDQSSCSSFCNMENTLLCITEFPELDPVCTCKSGFKGPNCSETIDDCEFKPCFNNGTCAKWDYVSDESTFVESYNCTCSIGFSGSNCEINLYKNCESLIECENGGSCEFDDTGQPICICSDQYYGVNCESEQPCKIQQADGSIADYCRNGGKCVELDEGAVCDCAATNYTGRRCEIRVNFNHNLVFNGLQYTPPVVSNTFSNSSAREFTICSFVQYNYEEVDMGENIPNLPPYLAMRSTGGAQQLVFDNYGFRLCDDQKTCVEGVVENSSFKKVNITPNTWHHFCVISPAANEVSPTYTAYLDGVKVMEQFANRFEPDYYGYLIIAPADLAPRDKLFQGMISMTQMYVVRLNETQIGKLAFDCYETFLHDDLLSRTAVLKWDSNFTRVSSVNPGVYTDSAGVCSNVKSMFGRQANAKNDSTASLHVDRIPPTVSRCPTTIYAATNNDQYAVVAWDEQEISFFDNIGIVKVERNFQNGQQFGVGIHTVRYVAFDESGNYAQCNFNVIVVKRKCPSQDQVLVQNGRISFVQNAGKFSPQAAIVQCNDPNFPLDYRPRFYTCDALGTYDVGVWVNRTLHLPACGTTIPARQYLNGTIMEYGMCEDIALKLREVLWNSIDCDTFGCKLRILPTCSLKRKPDDIALQYDFETSTSKILINTLVWNALKMNFDLSIQDYSIECNSTYPIRVISQNGTMVRCVKCPEGMFANLVENKCQACPIDTYRNASTSQLECVKCENGKTTGRIEGAVDRSQCYELCAVGRFAKMPEDRCEMCRIGSFGKGTGLIECESCPFDLSTENVGSITEEDCRIKCSPGLQMINRSCVECVVGYYKETDRGPCLQCPRGLTTLNVGSTSVSQCSVLECNELNTIRNEQITPRPDIPYNVLCVNCEQGTFQNVSNLNYCLPCSHLADDVLNIPITCQSTCSEDVSVDGCDCELSFKNSFVDRNCFLEIKKVKSKISALVISIPIIFGTLLVIIAVVVWYFRKKIVACIRKLERNDNQHVAAGFIERKMSTARSGIDLDEDGSNCERNFPRPNLQIVTNREELARLPPFPSPDRNLHFPRGSLKSRASETSFERDFGQFY